MFKDFEVDSIFEDQVHERYTFMLTIEDDSYRGVYHDDKIHWFHPQPQRDLEQEHLEAVEAEIHSRMNQL